MKHPVIISSIYWNISQLYSIWFMFSLIIMMKMINCFCGMVDRWKAFSLISSWDHCQKSPALQVSDTPRAAFEHVQNLSSGFVEWSYAVVITTTPGCHYFSYRNHFIHFLLKSDGASLLVVCIAWFQLIATWYTSFFEKYSFIHCHMISEKTIWIEKITKYCN